MGTSGTGWIKLNFDRSRNYSRKTAGRRFVIRDYEGRRLMASYFHLYNAFVLVAECMGLRNGLYQVSQKGFHKSATRG